VCSYLGLLTGLVRIVLVLGGGNPRESLIVKYGWNGILSESELLPDGLFDPVSCRNRRWTIANAVIIKGRIKWNAKNRVRVALSTENRLKFILLDRTRYMGLLRVGS
jgi:hypothetical protein